MTGLVSVRGVGKAYPLPEGEIRVFRGLDFDLEPEAQRDAEQYVATLLPRLAELGLISGRAS